MFLQKSKNRQDGKEIPQLSTYPSFCPIMRQVDLNHILIPYFFNIILPSKTQNKSQAIFKPSVLDGPCFEFDAVA